MCGIIVNAKDENSHKNLFGRKIIMLDMLKKLDKIMRILLVVTGSLFVVFKLLGGGRSEEAGKNVKKQAKEDYQIGEFDDIC